MTALLLVLLRPDLIASWGGGGMAGGGDERQAEQTPDSHDRELDCSTQDDIESLHCASQKA